MHLLIPKGNEEPTVSVEVLRQEGKDLLDRWEKRDLKNYGWVCGGWLTYHRALLNEIFLEAERRGYRVEPLDTGWCIRALPNCVEGPL
jgi:hypothetical protein